MAYTPRLKKTYQDEIIPKLMEQFGYKSVMQAPRVLKISMNQGLGKAVADKKIADTSVAEMTMITGQKAVKTISTKDISNFKLRKGMPIGAKVTLRSEKMYEFLDRLISVALPRTRDFKGVKVTGFDGRGNFSFGIKEQIIFPEISIEEIKTMNGFDVTIVTSANTDEEAKALLTEFGFPFTKK